MNVTVAAACAAGAPGATTTVATALAVYRPLTSSTGVQDQVYDGPGDVGTSVAVVTGPAAAVTVTTTDVTVPEPANTLPASRTAVAVKIVPSDAGALNETAVSAAAGAGSTSTAGAVSAATTPRAASAPIQRVRRSRAMGRWAERTDGCERRRGWSPALCSAAVEAAFFDLDKTVIAKASVVAFGTPLYKEGLISRRTILRGLWGQLVYLHLGADEDRIARMRSSVLALTKGWEQQRVRAIVEEALESVVAPIVFAEALELLRAHRAAGRMVVIVSASPEEIVGPLATYLGADHVDREPGATRRRGPLQRRDGLRRVRVGQGRRDPRARPSARARPRRRRTHTPTRRPTCPCSRPSATRSPSTPTASWRGWRPNAGGRSGCSPARCRYGRRSGRTLPVAAGAVAVLGGGAAWWWYARRSGTWPAG